MTFTTVATVTGSPLATSYLDTSVLQGVQYWYTVASSSFVMALALDTHIVYYSDGTSWIPVSFPTNATGITSYANLGSFPAANSYTGFGNSSATIAQAAIPTTTGEMTLSQIRLASMQRADRVNSNFVTLPEYTTFINLALFELYDLLITCYEDYYIGVPAQFTSDGTTFIYNLPDGKTTFTNGLNQNTTFAAPPFYKLAGADLAFQNATNAYVTINKFSFVDRNRFVYPNTASTIYGVFNLQYRLLGATPAGVQQIMFIPTPSAGQAIRLWYVPRMTQLLQDTDTTIQGISGWIDYVIIRTAKYVLDKEESDTTKLDQELIFLKQRIEETAANRDQGIPDKISDTRANNGSGYGGQGGFGWNGSIGGF